MTASKAPYHHGDLRSALVQAATELARQGGPQAVVLREAARRVGVSQTAAYRHFSALPELIQAVTEVALEGIAAAMEVELAQVVAPAGTAEAALARLHAVGRGYVRFALDEPGLYATAFFDAHDEDKQARAQKSPYQLLQGALGGLVEAGLLDPATRVFAEATAWAGVHGLSSLLLGPMSGVPAEELDGFVDSCLRLVALGLVSRGQYSGPP